MSYKYDDADVRTQKAVNNVTTNYFVTSGIQLSAQKCGDNVLTWRIAGNSVVSRFDYNGTSYFYIKNTQNDIIGITNASGNTRYYNPKTGRFISEDNEDFLLKNFVFKNEVFNFMMTSSYLRWYGYYSETCRKKPSIPGKVLKR